MARGGMQSLPFRKDAEAKRQMGDLRDIVDFGCVDCLYCWSAPTAKRCPRCHSEHLQQGEGRMHPAPRV